MDGAACLARAVSYAHKKVYDIDRRKVVVMAEGFISLPTVMHSNMVETQYVAPLMAR
jgi:hypothetical protein